MKNPKTMDRLLAHFQPDLSIIISWRHNGTTESSQFTNRDRPPAIFHCTHPGCLGTGFSLFSQVQSARAAANARGLPFVEYANTVECMGTIEEDGSYVRPCGRLFTVRISGTLIPPQEL